MAILGGLIELGFQPSLSLAQISWAGYRRCGLHLSNVAHSAAHFGFFDLAIVC
jgi:hypothetical protein